MHQNENILLLVLLQYKEYFLYFWLVYFRNDQGNPIDIVIANVTHDFNCYHYDTYYCESRIRLQIPHQIKRWQSNKKYLSACAERRKYEIIAYIQSRHQSVKGIWSKSSEIIINTPYYYHNTYHSSYLTSQTRKLMK